MTQTDGKVYHVLGLEDVRYKYIYTHTHIYIQNGILAIKRMKFYICNNMNGLGVYYAK